MLTLQSGVIFGTDLLISLWQSFFGNDQSLKRSNSDTEANKGFSKFIFF